MLQSMVKRRVQGMHDVSNLIKSRSMNHTNFFRILDHLVQLLLHENKILVNVFFFN